MTALYLLSELRRLGVEVNADAKRLRCRAPKGVLTPELRGQLAENREEVLRILRAEPPVSESSAPVAVKPIMNSESQPCLPFGNHQSATRRTEAARNSQVIAGHTVKRLYLEDTREAVFQDTDGRFYHFDLAGQMLTELPTRDTEVEEAIPPEVWSAFGALLGMTILRKERAAKEQDVSRADGEQHG